MATVQRWAAPATRAEAPAPYDAALDAGKPWTPASLNRRYNR